MNTRNSLLWCSLALVATMTATAADVAWFSEDMSKVTDIPAATSAKLTSGTIATSDGTTLLNAVLSKGENAVDVSADGVSVDYTPANEMKASSKKASISMSVKFGGDNDEDITGAKAGIRIGSSDNGLVFEVLDGGAWTKTAVTADADTTYAVTFDLDYTANTVTYKAGDTVIKEGAAISGVIETIAVTGTGSFASLSGTYEGGTPITPGVPLEFDDEASAKAAAESAEVSMSTEVAAVLTTEEQKKAYVASVKAVVNYNAETGKWEVSFDPTDATVITAKEEAADASKAIVATPGVEKVSINSIPGYFYSISAGSAPASLEAGEKKIGTGAAIELKIKKIEGNAGFFKPVIDVK